MKSKRICLKTHAIDQMINEVRHERTSDCKQKVWEKDAHEFSKFVSRNSVLKIRHWVCINVCVSITRKWAGTQRSHTNTHREEGVVQEDAERKKEVE